MAEKAKATKTAASGKGQATPTRKEREAANRRPLVGEKTKEGRKLSKEQLAAERKAAREGMLRGEEKYLPIRDRGPQKKMARDIVDARFSLGELILPAMFVFLIATTVNIYYVQLASLIVMWVLFACVVADALLLGRRVEREISSKFGYGKVERGLRWYAAMRSIQLRPMRMPKPQVKRNKR
jgi:Flp pilus assembly protein TadB